MTSSSSTPLPTPAPFEGTAAPGAGAPLGVCILPTAAKNAPRTVQYAAYLHEMLGHAGVCYEAISWEDLPTRLNDNSLRLLVTVGEYAFPDDLRTQLTAWVEDGGAWLSLSGVCGLPDLLGVDLAPPTFVLWGGALRTLGEGYLTVAEGINHPVAAGLAGLPLHFFSGAVVTARPEAQVLATCQDAHGRPTDTPGLIAHRAGKGQCLLIAPDVTGSVVRIQQGTAITRDGIPSPDGTGPVTDGVLKTDDGQALDWLLDREPMPGVPGLSSFLRPAADRWRDLVLRCLFHLASEQNVALPLLWYHPENLPAVGHISHDTDGNVPSQAWKLLETLQEAGIRSTWCTILPGYAPDIIDAVRAAGHELATHYDAVTDGIGPFSEAEFDRQWRLLCEMFGPNDAPVTNKNHYLRWEGDVEFFEWCIARGIRLEQSKGTSKSGEVGFNFGTCHLYRPVRPDGSVLPIHELPTPTQDLRVFAPEEIVPPLLESVLAHYGVLHLLFHPAHIDKPGVADAIKNAVRLGQERGLAWRTGRELADWEEARRKAVWSGCRDGRATLTLPADASLPGATVLILDPNGATERWGFRFRVEQRNLTPGSDAAFETN